MFAGLSFDFKCYLFVGFVGSLKRRASDLDFARTKDPFMCSISWLVGSWYSFGFFMLQQYSSMYEPAARATRHAAELLLSVVCTAKVYI